MVKRLRCQAGVVWNGSSSELKVTWDNDVPHVNEDVKNGER